VNRTGWVSAAALVALGATHQALSPGVQPRPAQQAETGSRSLPGQSEPRDLCAALRAFYSLPPNPNKSGACLPGRHKILFVIATAPNPANSQLALSFDRTVESIERAAGDRGFLFDRFVFPWDAEPNRQLEPDKKRKEEKRRRLSEGMPGMLLFRGYFEPGDPMQQFDSLAVMLVPENPSSGVNVEAFQTAATFASKNSPGVGPIPILGPGFSSSAVSLNNAMHRSALRYVIRSGCATVPDAWNSLNDDSHSFAAAVRDDDQLNEALFKHLDPNGEWKKVGRIAVLSESGTLYGAHASASQQDTGRLNLVFPRGISWLRNAYQDLPSPTAPNLPPGIVSPAAPRLPFAISEPTYGDDKTPSLSAAQTPISQEAALLSITNTLRQERVRFVVITSTDPLDNIFLIRFLRTHCPDLRIITFESDLLYVRATTEFPATGVILVTTYPLFLQNQVWSSFSPSENRVPFDSMGSEGTYNALRSLLMLSANAPPGDRDLPFEYGGPFESGARRPPVWLTVTTPNGYWPLAVLGDNDLTQSSASRLLYWWPKGTNDDPTGAERTPVIAGVNRLWYSLAFGLTGICIVLLLAVQGRLNCSNFPLLCSLVYRLPQDENELGRAFCRTVMLWWVAMLCLVLAWPVVVLRRNGPGWVALVMAGVLVALAIGLLLAAVSDGMRQRWRPFARKWRHILLFAIAIGLVLFWIEWWRQTFYGGFHHEGFFAAYRSLDLVNGVAPTIPFALIVLALICWAWAHLKRLHMFAESPHSVPALGARFLERKRADGLVRYVSLVNAAVGDPFLLPGGVYAASTSGCVALYFIMGEYTQGLELRPFDVLYGVTFVVIVLLLVLACARTVFMWTRLRCVLRTIELHPIRETFSTVAFTDIWGPILHRSIDQDHLERRYCELLHKTGRACAEATTDSALEELRSETLDPAWARKDVDDASFKASAEVFALRYVAFIQPVCRQIENLLIFLPIGFVLTLISLNSYPFQSGHVLGWFMATLLVGLGIAVTFVLASSERDHVLSLLNGTTPGKIGKDFYMNLLSYGALPVLTVLAAQFPAVGAFLFSWVQPVLQALRV